MESSRNRSIKVNAQPRLSKEEIKEERKLIENTRIVEYTELFPKSKMLFETIQKEVL